MSISPTSQADRRKIGTAATVAAAAATAMYLDAKLAIVRDVVALRNLSKLTKACTQARMLPLKLRTSNSRF